MICSKIQIIISDGKKIGWRGMPELKVSGRPEIGAGPERPQKTAYGDRQRGDGKKRGGKSSEKNSEKDQENYGK